MYGYIIKRIGYFSFSMIQTFTIHLKLDDEKIDL